MTARKLKKARTREAIAVASLTLFLERGFESTTADDIAEAAGVSRRTFFRYFPTKEAAFFASQHHRLEMFRGMLDEPLPGETPYRTVRRCLLCMGEIYMAERSKVVAQHRIIQASQRLMAYELKMDYEWDKLIAETLTRGDYGAERGEQLPVALAGALMGLTRAVLRQWFIAGGEMDLVERGERAIDLLEDGFGLRHHSSASLDPE